MPGLQKPRGPVQAQSWEQTRAHEPGLWHLQIEDQVVETFLGDAVMEAHCGNRRGHEQGQQPGAHPHCPDTHPGPQPAAQALQGGPIHPTKGLWLPTVWAGEGPGGHCRQSLRGELWALQPTDPKSTSEGLRHLVFPVFSFPLTEGDPVPSQSLARSPAPKSSGEPQKGAGRGRRPPPPGPERSR